MAHLLRRFLLLDWLISRAERRTTAQHGGEPAETTLWGMPDELQEARLAHLTGQLNEPDWRVRLAAVEQLSRLRDPATAGALVHLLHDENLSVRWAAAAGLKRLHRAAIRPLLEELTREFQSTSLRQASHHVLYDLYMNGNLNSREIAVCRMLERPASGIQVAKIANQALIASDGRY